MKRFVTLASCLLFSHLVAATNVRLITIGPGDAFWSAFGHTAIAIDEVVYGFGYFSFDDDIISSFINNQMQYDLGVSDINHELILAEQQNRTFSVIDLKLSESEKSSLSEYLKWHYKPENQTYTYDYFINNCSTKIRDLLNEAWSGELKLNNDSLSGSNYFKQTFPAPKQGLMNFGLAIGYGWPAYKDRSHWELMALPVYFENQLSQSSGSRVHPTQIVYQSAEHEAVESTLLTHWTVVLYMVFWTLLLIIPGTQVLTAKIWLGLHGLIGLILMGLWMFTPHQVADWNFNLLLFNPMGLFFNKFKWNHKILSLALVAWLVIAVSCHAWYLIGLLVPAFLALKVLKNSN